MHVGEGILKKMFEAGVDTIPKFLSSPEKGYSFGRRDQRERGGKDYTNPFKQRLQR